MTVAADWLQLPSDHLFGVSNLPYGVFSPRDGEARVGCRVGDRVLDLGAAAEAAGMESALVWQTGTLNAFLAEGRSAWAAGRAWIVEMLTNDTRRDCVEPFLYDLDAVTLHLPFEVADYVDFYASEQHATNVGSIFRPDGDALTPNWKHLPIGYHGRAGTVVVSGTDIVRPTGQRKGPQDPAPVFGPSVRLDIEAELGFVVGDSTQVGTRVGVDQAEDHLFGVTLFNDWSARDIQAWEYVPLGPFLGKSFASSVGAWVVPMEALAAARVDLPGQDPQPLDYLRGSALFGLDISLEVAINGTVVSRPPYLDMYWSPTQMLAHLTVNGASLRPGDLFASGTISGDDKGERGSLLELTWAGKEPITLGDGTTRAFLEDGDTVTITGTAPGPHGTRIGLGEVTGTILSAR
ncbi:fumarylacetoacetase [Luteipulveratus sp. YIM 133132]|uniref:fumarylacetoacetase n=1 Tax=Luteipulveratus flavus TaxID=3031728 RepID=UPI0023B14616|nr:fumarylacetoacetase [Luteipulveratus sp. YIM 133132]MDE9367817.1 fumarylacetoacetase [Luteipulveratus sp. YIM 133132]